MFLKIKNKIEKEIKSYIQSNDKLHTLKKISPLLFKNIKEFILRHGKRIRPILFIVSYRGFAKFEPRGLYRSALALEFLHDFMLIHDDIIDKSDTRRGKPSMHIMLNDYLKKYKDVKFNGQDLSIVVGDVMYAMAIHTFLSIKTATALKEKGLKLLIDAAMYTGSGEFIELLAGAKPIEKIAKEEIYKIYDLKTARYTFAAPLAMGATLAAAEKKQINFIYEYGIYSGRAFQIKDDILGTFGDEKKIGKSIFTDLQEAKKTVLIWYAYKKSSRVVRKTIQEILIKKNIDKNDLSKICEIIASSGALKYAKDEIARLLNITKHLHAKCKMREPYKSALYNYFQELLALPA
jgi:geranylgeranyl diphosphate synthase type I